MTETMNRINAAALDWIVQVADPSFEDWDAFTEWLEADPRHAARYQTLEADAAAMAKLVSQEPRQLPLPVQARPLHRRRWLVGALAASVAGIVGYGALQDRPAPYAVETIPGVTRTIALSDGSSIALNGATRLILDSRNARIAKLERGEAFFTVRHDPARPFRVTVGENELLDVGTAFDVVRADRGLRVGVAEGAVLFNPNREAVKLTAGRSLRLDRATIRLSSAPFETVGSWRKGTLDFSGEPLVQVAADLSRALGINFAVTRSIAQRPYRGTIALDGLKQDPRALAALLGAELRPITGGWEIAPLP